MASTCVEIHAWIGWEPDQHRSCGCLGIVHGIFSMLDGARRLEFRSLGKASSVVGIG